MPTHRSLLRTLSVVIILSILFSGFSAASAQDADGLERQVNAQTGKVSFLSPENGQLLSFIKALGISTRPQDPAMALAKRFAPEFGLKDPGRELQEMSSDRADDGRITARYQQTYQGIPVMGGELIVNTNENGDLYSINGEVSANLSVSSEPTISAEDARQRALQAAAKWYGETPKDFAASEPALWIYDESLLRPSTRPVELVWRMEVSPKELGMPVRELVLVNAQRGSISLHFNQIDTVWAGSQKTPLILNDAAQTGATWYVATTGSDSNSCSSAASPCATINGSLGKAAAGDTIKVAVGTYTSMDGWVVEISKSITLSGGWNASFTAQTGRSTINGQGARRGIVIFSGSVVIDHFTIQNAFAQFDSGAGAGILNQGTLLLSNSIVSGNESQSTGGGIWNRGMLTINDSIISDNGAGSAGTGAGGGGGIENNGFGSTVILNNSTVSNNLMRGGFSGSGISNSGNLVLNNSVVSGNMGHTAIEDQGRGSITLNNSTISGNPFGGISKQDGAIIVNNSTITNNGSGISLYLGDITMQNSLLAGNIAGYVTSDCYGNMISLGYNLIGQKSDSCRLTPTTGDLVGTSAKPINPRLAPLQNNGGSTLTHALMSGSPALNAGNPAMPGSGGNACLAADQRGVARPIDDRCDIGAYEGPTQWTPPYRVSTYTANRSFSLPGSFVCDQTDSFCFSGDSHAKAAHIYAIGTYNLYAVQHGRNSINNHGMTIISSVHYCEDIGCPYDNASWTGEQMLYGDRFGYPLADDVVAHEITHGVTQYESNLFYYYQSGAINESFSDLWGEYYDQTNGWGNDNVSAGIKWKLGEDVSGMLPLRDMSNPPAYGHPDRMTSPFYFLGEEDGGGVHYNSSVNNKAVYLLVDGGNFNGRTVSALGWEKTAAIYYQVNTNLLSSGADYSDLYYALQRACSNLIGQKGITTSDCDEVKDAIDAVEMNAQPSPNFNTDAPYCEAGKAVVPAFSDDLESGTGNWTFNNGAHPRWQVDTPYGPYAQSGLHSLFANDYPEEITDARARLKSFTVPANAYLRFAQAYGFESGYNPGNPTFYNFDGGVLEYSLNNGSTWQDAGFLMDHNGYTGTLFTGAGNPLSGRYAFVGDSHGYISTRLNLADLAGQTVSFRWRMGLDQAGYDWGWWVDNIQVYTCHRLILSTDTAGVFRPSNGLLYLKNSNMTGFADVEINYGIGGDYPVVGDWDGDGDVTIGIYRNGSFYLRNSNTIGFADKVFPFGTPGDQPVAGDWDGDGIDTIGVYRNGTFMLRNTNDAGAPQMIFGLGVPGDIGITGDWDGNGTDSTGVFRPSNGLLYLKHKNETGFADIEINYGIGGDHPVAGDWNNDGIDTIGVYRNGSFYLRNSNTIGFADLVFALGVPGDHPIAGNWDGLP